MLEGVLGIQRSSKTQTLVKMFQMTEEGEFMLKEAH
jgi:hypothetical protein